VASSISGLSDTLTAKRRTTLAQAPDHDARSAAVSAAGGARSATAARSLSKQQPGPSQAAPAPATAASGADFQLPRKGRRSSVSPTQGPQSQSPPSHPTVLPFATLPLPFTYSFPASSRPPSPSLARPPPPAHTHGMHPSSSVRQAAPQRLLGGQEAPQSSRSLQVGVKNLGVA